MAGRRVPPFALLVITVVCAPGLQAQEQVPCDSQIIHAILVEPSVLFTEESDPRFVSQVAQWLGNSLSWRTRESTIRGELRFTEGDRCDAGLLAESARVLRAQPYLRSADIVAITAGEGTVDVIVRTRDELGLEGALRVETRGGVALRAFRLTEENLMGLGMLYQLRYDNLGRRPGLEVDVLHRQVLGRNDVALVAGRTSVGPVGEMSVGRVFESELDSTAWRADLRFREEPFALGSESLGTVTQPMGVTGGNMGFAVRSGQGETRLMAGLSVTYERLFVAGAPLAALPEDDSIAGAALAGRYTELRRFSTNLILGYRSVEFLNRRDPDGVDAIADLRDGVELRMILGRGWNMGSGTQRDWFGLADLHVGGELSRRLLVFVRSRVEARYLEATDRWDGVIATGDLFTYVRPGPRTLVALNVQSAGGWNTSTPFQMMLSGQYGMHGYGMGSKPVGRRVVAQAEHRYLLGTIFRAADLGTSLFVEAGRGWAGDAPFAENTPTLWAAGVGLRGAFPAGSRLTTRLDITAPLSGGHGVEVRLILRQTLGIGRAEAADVSRSRLPLSAREPFQFTRY